MPWRCTIALVLAATAGCSDGNESPAQIVEQSAVEHGAALFDDPGVVKSPFNAYACSTCHEAKPGGTSLILPGAPLEGAVDRPSYWGGSEVELLRAINHCLYFFMLKDEPWTPADTEARAIYAYLESLPGGPSSAAAVPFTIAVAVEDPPPGDAARGNEVYARACASCHGALHTGAGRLVERATILPEGWLEAHPLDEYTPLERRLLLVEKVRHGGFLGYGGQMPPFSRERLRDQDLGDLLTTFGVP